MKNWRIRNVESPGRIVCFNPKTGTIDLDASKYGVTFEADKIKIYKISRDCRFCNSDSNPKR